MAHQHLTGSQLQVAVIQMARFYGWKVAHFHSVRIAERNITITPVAADGKGFPDLILVRHNLIAAEIKGDKESVRPDQKDWAAALTRAEVPIYLWRPKDWHSGEIEEVLK